MKKQEFNKEISSLTELLRSKFPSSLTKRIELDDKFFTEAQQFADETLDFSYYSELEKIVNTSKLKGVIKKIDVSKNENLTELTFPNQKLTNLDLSENTKLEKIDVCNNKISGKLNIGNCPNLKIVICKNNYLNSLRVHINLFNNNTLKVQKDNLCPQKDRFGEIIVDKVHWKNDIYWNTPLENEKGKSTASNLPADRLVDNGVENSQNFYQGWRNIHPGFTPELQQRWKNKGFAYEQTKEWIDIGLIPQDDDYVAWLRDIKQVDSNWVLNNGNEEDLRKEYQRYRECFQPSWKGFYKWLQKEIITQGVGERVKLKENHQDNYPDLTESALNRFVDSCEATLDKDNSFHLFQVYDNNKTFEELFSPNTIFCGKKTDKKKIGGVSYAGLKKLFYDWKKNLISSSQSSQLGSRAKEISSLSEKEAKGRKPIQEFIEQNLKKIYESCLVYFDIQENSIIVKNKVTKERKALWDKKEPELRQIRIQLQQARSLGVDTSDLPEPPPQHWEDICEDVKYQLEENYFKLMIATLNEWETKQSKEVENVSSLIEFLEWIVTEQKRLEKEAEKVREQWAKEILNLELKKEQKRIEEFLKSIHPDFTPELQKEWEDNDFNYEKCKEWINVGLRPKDSIYAAWLCACNCSPSDYLEFNDDKLLREKFQQCLLESADDEEERKIIAAGLRRLSLEDNDNNNSEEVRNILLIGRTGSGKSTLVNVLVNKNNNFEEIFKESAGSVSETKSIRTEKFTVDLSRDGTQNINYSVIDTAGFGDTQLDNKEILGLLKDLVPIIKKNGLNQIFFVTGGRFTRPEIDTYKLLESVLFNKGATKYTTIIRTKFPDFMDKDECEEDRKELQSENLEVFKILRASKIIYVNNPPVVGRENSVKSAKETREESRKRLLTYLGTCQDNYYPTDLENLNKRIDNYIASEEKLKKEIELKEQKIKEEQAELQKEVESIQAQKDYELKITERNFERQIQDLQTKNQQKLQTTQQEFEEVHQAQLREYQEAHSKEVREIKQVIQNNLRQIRNNYNYIKVGKPVCHYGHDSNIKTYDKSGSLITDCQSDFIDHVYCPTCGRNDYNFTLRNARTLSLEEWSRKNSQHATERRKKMKEDIDEQNRKEQEIINRINQEKANREAESSRSIRELKSLQEQVERQLQRVKEELIRQQKQIGEDKITSSSQGKIDKLKKELAKKEQALEEQVKKSEASKNVAQQELYAYIEQRRN